MTTHARLNPEVSVTAHLGTVYITWPDGSTSAEAEDDVGALLLSCRRSQPVERLVARHGEALVERLLRARLITPAAGGDVIALHRCTLTAGTDPDAAPGPDDFHAADDGRLLREYGAGDALDLPAPDPVSGDLVALLTARSSARAFSGRPLTRRHVSTVLATALGTHPGAPVRPRVPGAPPARPGYPSPGALYPVELALAVWTATDLEPAAYRYQPLGHRLLRCGDLSGAAPSGLAGPTPEAASGLVVLWCDLTGPAFAKYGTKGYRLMLLEAGHIMQNLVLVAQAVGLAALPLAGFHDEELAAVLGLGLPEQVPVYGLLLGGAP